MGFYGVDPAFRARMTSKSMIYITKSDEVKVIYKYLLYICFCLSV